MTLSLRIKLNIILLIHCFFVLIPVTRIFAQLTFCTTNTELSASLKKYKTATVAPSILSERNKVGNNSRIHTTYNEKTTSSGMYFNLNIGIGYSVLPTYKYGYIQSSNTINSEVSPIVKEFTIRGIGPMVDVAFYPVNTKNIFIGVMGKGAATYFPGTNSSHHSILLDIGIRGGIGGNDLKVIGEYSLKKRLAKYTYSYSDESSSLSNASRYNATVDVVMRRIAFGLRFGDGAAQSAYLEVRYFLDKIYLSSVDNFSKGLDFTIHVNDKIDVGFEISKNYIRTGNISIDQPYDDERRKTTGTFVLFSLKKSFDFKR